MAEARMAVTPLTRNEWSMRGLETWVDDDGVHLHFALTVPPVRFMARGVYQFARRRWTKFWNEFFPVGPAVVVPVVGGLVWAVNRAPPDNWFRSGPVASWIWDQSLKLPFHGVMSHQAHVTTLAVGTGLLFGVLLARLNRHLLRLLLLYKGWLFQKPGQRPSLLTKVWGGILKLLSGRKPSLFSWQQSLPRLPVPAVRDTVDRVLLSMKPLTTEAEFAELSALGESFVKNEGRKFQRYIKLRSWFVPNYVTDWWEKFVYLRSRSPIMIHSNYYGLDSLSPPQGIGQCARGANIVYRFMRFKHLIDNEQPFNLNHEVPPMCMKQYERVFSTTRVPGRECDQLVHRAADAKTDSLVVLCNGRYFSFRIYTSSGALLKPYEIEYQLEVVKQMAARVGRPPLAAEAELAALTAGDRTTWAVVREECFSEGLNRRSLAALERAVFVVVLDDGTPQNFTEMGRLAMHGDGTDRWVDKSFQLILFANGRASLNVEHSFADAPVISHMFEVGVLSADFHGPQYSADGHNEGYAAMLAGGAARKSGGGGGGGTGAVAPAVGHLPKPTLLRWEVEGALAESVAKAKEAAQALVSDFDLVVLDHDAFGKGLMKKVRVSPDGFVQMALSLAFWRLRGRLALTYESAMTRLWREGRTETVRPVTCDSKAFVDAMVDAQCSNAERARLLRVAVETHTLNSKKAMVGEGVDRHLFALYVCGIGLNTESPFLAKVMGQKWTVSTSQQPQHQTTHWNPAKLAEHAARVSPGGGFGPVANDGFGVSYMVLENRLFFHISCSVKGCAETSAMFAAEIERALADLKTLMESVTEAAKKRQ